MAPRKIMEGTAATSGGWIGYGEDKISHGVEKENDGERRTSLTPKGLGAFVDFRVKGALCGLKTSVSVPCRFR